MKHTKGKVNSGATLALGSPFEWEWRVEQDIDGNRKYGVLNSAKQRFKLKNTATNDTYDYECLVNLMENFFVKLNRQEVYRLGNNLPRVTYLLNLLKLKDKKEAQRRQWFISGGTGPDIHEANTILGSTTSKFYEFPLEY